jgi:response regulator RpfG family c-di-GMP phosphodiesterase
MANTPLPVVLCVDDEPQILAGLSVSLRRRYEVLTATSGAEALQMLAARPDTAVVMSDMRMPGMDGAAVLAKAKEIAPDAVRMLLTGHAEIDAAIHAVNEGQIFRFLTKPCPAMTLLSSMYHAVEHHKLMTAERVLLEQTLRGVIKALTDVLALTNPVSFGRASRIKAKVSKLAEALQLPDRWQVEVAAMLSPLGGLVLSPDTAARVYHGKPLSADDTRAVARMPEITDQLLANIPRMEDVRAILTASTKLYFHFEALEDERDAQIARAGHVLKAASDFDALESSHRSSVAAIAAMQARVNDYDAAVLAALPALLGPGSTHEPREVTFSGLTVGMIVAEDVHTDSGTLLVARGLELTAGMVERMHNVRTGTTPKQLVKVLVPCVREEEPALIT